MAKAAKTSRRSRVLRVGLGALLVFSLFVAAPLLHPSPLFAHRVERGDLSFRSDAPIPAAPAMGVLEEIERRLARSPLGPPDASLPIYVVERDWVRSWLWIVPPGTAGGFVAPPVTRGHAFFSGADFEADSLIGPTGYRTKPPRTLAYYGAHELTHVMTIRRVGGLGFHLRPEWVIEGLADYVGMPAESASALYAKIGRADADLPMMKAHGVYAPYRLAVTWFLEDEGWTIEELLETDLDFEEARAIVWAGIERAARQ